MRPGAPEPGRAGDVRPRRNRGQYAGQGWGSLTARIERKRRQDRPHMPVHREIRLRRRGGLRLRTRDAAMQGSDEAERMTGFSYGMSWPAARPRAAADLQGPDRFRGQLEAPPE